MLTMNPCTSSEDILDLYEFNTETVMRVDRDGKTSMDCARGFNVGGLITLIGGLCKQRRMTLAIRDFCTSWRRINSMDNSPSTNKKRKLA